jgi:hypothetical protein
MLLAKKYLLSFLIVASLGILQLSTVFFAQPALADQTLISNQKLLTDTAAGSYGSNKPKDVKIIALDILQTVLTFLAIIFVVLILLAGFKYMTSMGNESKIKEVGGQLQSLVIGLIIILSAWGITKYLLDVVVCRTTTSGTACNFWG